MPANLEKSICISEEKEPVVSAKKKLEKANSVKVKKAMGAPDTKNAAVTKFAGAAPASSSTHTASSNSAQTATVSALREQPGAQRRRSAFGSTTAATFTYEPRKSLGAAGEPRKSFGKAGNSESMAQKPENLVAKARKAY